jgi:hypothetical protein
MDMEEANCTRRWPAVLLFDGLHLVNKCQGRRGFSGRAVAVSGFVVVRV